MKENSKTSTAQEKSLKLKELRENLPEDVRAAVEAMERVQRLRNAIPARQLKTYRYFQVC